MKVFIVDDSTILCSRLKRLIETVENCQVCGEAGSVSTAVPAILEKQPDIVIIDVQLTDGLGFEVFDQVNQTGLKPVYIILTNYPTPHYKKLCDNRKIHYFFDKTTDFEKVITTLKEFSQAGN